MVPSSTVGCFAERDGLTEREEEEEEEEELVARGLEHSACPRQIRPYVGLIGWILI